MFCATNGCERQATGKSKYCPEHKAVARERWREMVAEGQAAKLDREREFADLFQRASRAAGEAYRNVTPRPMGVVEPRTGESWHVPEGVCGFAWVTVRPGTCSFARWLVKHGYGKAAYGGGIQVWSSQIIPNDNGQSYERKTAGCEAAAEVFRAAGVKAYSDGRLD
jgi:hypothetical protein